MWSEARFGAAVGLLVGLLGCSGEPAMGALALADTAAADLGPGLSAEVAERADGGEGWDGVAQDAAGGLDAGDASLPDSGATDSGATDSGATDSGATDSGATDSGDTDSGDTDSGDTDSGDTDPCAACNDNNPCTVDTCLDVQTGECAFAPVPLPCEDGDPCTVGDQCDNDGACHAGSLAALCEDGNPCTAGACVAFEGCVQNAISEGQSCDDGDLCTGQDQCQAGVCEGGLGPDCDDQNPCTQDVCNSGLGCAHEADLDVCQDGNPCTFDTCDPALGCAHPPVEDGAACDDGEPCLSGDTCQGASCVAGPVVLVCDDKNPCTVEQCEPGVGCVKTPLADGAPCDDGQPATVDDQCKQGACKGVADDCAALLSPFDPVMKVTAMTLTAKEAESLDVDGDGTLDNNLAPMAGFINGPLGTAIASSGVMYVVQLDGFNEALQPFSAHFFRSELAASDAGCDVQIETCDYVVHADAFDADCTPLSNVEGVFYSGTQLYSEGGGSFTLAFAFGDELWEVALYRVKVALQVAVEGGVVSSFSGTLGGAMLKADLVDLANLIDAAIPLGQVIEDGIDADIDVFGTGALDGISVGAMLSGIGGNIVGTAP